MRWSVPRSLILVAAIVVLGVTATGFLSRRERVERPVADEPQLKPLIRGLVDRDDLAAPAARTVVTAFVVNVGWAELQPAPGAAIPEGNPIDRAVARARQANAAPGAPGVQVKVRLFSGVQAPEWAKQLTGPPVGVTDAVSGRSGTVGRFWTADFGSAYRRLQQQLATRYDRVPEIAEITASRCTTVFAEPFLRQAGEAATVQGLLAAGFSAGADRRCLEEQVEAHRVWKRTRTSVAFNPYQRIRPDGTFRTDEAFTRSMMDHCRRVLGSRCIIANNSIRWPPLGGKAYKAMYASMRELGPPMTFQTAVPRRIGDWRRTLEWAVVAGANSVELNAGYASYPIEELRVMATRLKENPGGS